MLMLHNQLKLLKLFTINGDNIHKKYIKDFSIETSKNNKMKLNPDKI